jgi:RNA polymerase sigma factor (sigma-70 family)
VTVAAPAPTDLREPDAPYASPQVSAWAGAIEAGVLAAAARADPQLPWRGDATEEELRAIEEAGARAQQEFVAANLGLVGSVLGRYARAGTPVADLFQEGCLGLIAAVERFDHRRGVRFSTYATYWIRRSVSSATSRFASAVTIPVGRTEQLRTAHGVESALIQRLGRLPTVAEVAADLGRGERWTAGLLGQRGAQSLDDLDEAALHRLAGSSVPPGEASTQEPEVWARRLLATLTGFDRRVLELRLGFGGRPPTSLASVARELAVPVGRVRRAESRALEQLRGRCPREAMAGVAS